MKRGEIHMVRFNPTEGSEQAGIRPAVIVSNDHLNARSPIVIVVPLTTDRDRHLFRTHAAIPRSEQNGLDADSVALCEQVRSISKARLLRLRGEVSSQVLAQIDAALLDTLELHRRPQ